MHLIKIKSY